MSELRCFLGNHTQEDFDRWCADRNEVSDAKWYNFGDKKICDECLEEILVKDIAGLKLVNVTDNDKIKFDKLDFEINKWGILYYRLTNLCEFCFILDNTTTKICDGDLQDDENHCEINICIDCHNNFDAVVDKLFGDDKNTWGIPREINEDGTHKYTKEELLKLKNAYNPIDNNEFMVDCTPVSRSHLLPACTNLDDTINMYVKHDGSGISDGQEVSVKPKEWVFITPEPKDGWYHGYGGAAILFNCTKERFGELCTLFCTDSGYAFDVLGHYNDYVKCAYEYYLKK